MGGIIKFSWVVEALIDLFNGGSDNFFMNFLKLIKAIERAI